MDARRRLTRAILGLWFLLSPAPAWSDGPAVSAVNGKLDLQGGDSSGTGIGMAEGSVSAPLGQYFGIQLDGALGKRDPRVVGGNSGHVFWRNPGLGLAGITAERAWIGSQFFDRFGVETEYYAELWTLAGSAGYQNGFAPHSLYTKLDLRIYAADDLMFSLGVHQTGGRYLGRGGVEWQAGTIEGVGGIALFADGGIGTHGNDFILAGIRFYFGENKSLKRRHREDDPPNTVGSDLLDNAGFLHSSSPAGSGGSGSGGGGGGGPCHGPSCGVGGPG